MSDRSRQEMRKMDEERKNRGGASLYHGLRAKIGPCAWATARVRHKSMGGGQCPVCGATEGQAQNEGSRASFKISIWTSVASRDIFTPKRSAFLKYIAQFLSNPSFSLASRLTRPRKAVCNPRLFAFPNFEALPRPSFVSLDHAGPTPAF